MKAREIMTENPACCTPNDGLDRVAQLMVEKDCGCLPVVDDMQQRHILGVVTDRDLVARATAQGRGPDTTVQEVMSASPSCCTPETDVEEVERIMADHQVRRVPVVDEDNCCVGMIAQADLAREAHRHGRVRDDEVAHVVEEISEPSERSRV